MRTIRQLILVSPVLLLGLATAGEPETAVRPSDLLGSPSATKDTEHGTVRVSRGVVRMEASRGSEEFWNPGVSALTRVGVARGDVALVSFRARCPRSPSGGEGLLDVFFQRSSAPWEKSLHSVVAVGPEWTRHHYPFVVRLDLPPGEAQIGFGAGRQPQVIEISDVTVLDYGPGQDIHALPRTSATYAGRSKDAAWRKEAEARIEKHRKAELTIRVRDPEGNPVTGAAVRVRMRRHAFRFGSTVAVPAMTAGGEDEARYKAAIVELFNHASIENALKWPRFAPGGWQGSTSARKRTKESLLWLRSNGIRVHGHVLVWPSWGQCPPSLERFAEDPVKLRAAIDGHISEMMAFTRGLVDEWDVVNEPMGNEDLMNVLGPKVMADWFRAARRGDPDVRLYVNDRGILNAGTRPNAAHQDRFHRLIRFLLDRFAPVDAIGLQAHFDENLTPPATVVRDLSRYEDLGLPIQITEFDVVTTDEQLQADYTRDFMTAVFSHPGVNGFCMWGFWEGSIWSRPAAMFRQDWSIKPNGEVYKDLVFRRWWTDERGRTDADGRLAVRGFLGRYEVTARAAGREGSAEVFLGPGSAAVDVVLE